ncbi:MAG: pyrroline-5-carboxylate reductase [Burkholderiales bacterium PBB1]|nr:MAG: pyrroline-5-carboxylate reductase [Burkholderiales bacterium PBB1]
MTLSSVVFVGGGNMAGALMGGLVRSGWAASAISVIEPEASRRAVLEASLGVRALGTADPTLGDAECVVWAVKPQLFQAAAAPCAAHIAGALQLSVMAGIRSDAIVRATGSDRVVRAMPNTPALIGKGISGLYARPAVSPDECVEVERLLAPTGEALWVEREEQLDAVTALSGSGPAYVFYVLEAWIDAGVELGLSPAQSRQLALSTLAGATALAQDAGEPPEVLRQRVTSKGGTTHAAISSLDADGVKAAFLRALKAAHRRAAELGDEFGR